MAPKSLCLTAAFAPVPAFLGGSCPLGCSLSAPATGGFSVFSLQCNMYAAGSEKEKRAGGPLHGGYYSTIVLLLQEGAPPGRRVLLWPAPSFNGGSGLACAAIPPAPPSNVFRNRGTPPVPPAGAAPLHPAWGRDERGLMARRPAILPALPWDVFQNRGTRCTPGGGCVSCTLLGAGMGGGLMARTPLSRPLCPGTFSRAGGQGPPSYPSPVAGDLCVTKAGGARM